MPKKYVPEGAYLACNKGTSPCTLRVSNNQRTTIYNVPMASELDFIPFFNIKPMGFCTCPAKIASTGITCIPGVVTPWQNPKDGIKINGSRLILEDSHNNCIFGGEIKIFFDRPSAVAFGVGEGKMPSEYIKEGFDWLDEKVKDGRKERDKLLPDWMKPVTGVQDWFTDLGTGLVEGAVNGVVGLGETLYQVGQDPVGTTEALGGMIKDGATAAWEGANSAAEWASKGENWENAANGAWDWASDGENWKKAGESTVQGVKDSAEWVAENPRKIGNTVGEFIPDAAAAVATMGGSTAVTAGRVALKETAEAAVERAVKETVEEGVEKAGKEALEAGAKKAGKELIESLTDDAGDIAKVVTKDADEIVEKAGSKGGWNKTLNGELKPNSIYNVDGYKYHTDELGRVTKVEGDLKLKPKGRNTYQQGKSVELKDGIKGQDDGGHLIGDRFDGPGEQINYVPQKGSLNKGAYKKMENEWDTALKEGKSVKVEIENIYDGTSKRPIGQSVKYEIDGKKVVRDFEN